MGGVKTPPKMVTSYMDAPSKRTAHDLRHCTMNLIDCVAHAHGGGAWPLLAFHVEEDTNDKAWTSLYLDERP